MFKWFLVVAILVAFVDANYNFQDSDFNQLLLDDLTATADNDDDLLRFRRGVADSKHCRRKKIKNEDENHCCGAEGIENRKDLDAIKEVKKICVAEVRDKLQRDLKSNHSSSQHDPLKYDSVLTLRQQMVCTGECMAKRFDLIDENGVLKRDALLGHTRKLVGENTWKAGVLEEYLDKCLHELNGGVTKNDTCNSNPLDVHHCIWKRFVQGCPTEMQVDSKKCKMIRQRLASEDASSAKETPNRH